MRREKRICAGTRCMRGEEWWTTGLGKKRGAGLESSSTKKKERGWRDREKERPVASRGREENGSQLHSAERKKKLYGHEKRNGRV